MIDLKEATEIAKKFIIEMEGDQEGFHLESALLSTDKKRWEVIYSFRKSIENLNDLQKIIGLKERKIFKKVIIDSESREIIGYSNGAYETSFTV